MKWSATLRHIGALTLLAVTAWTAPVEATAQTLPGYEHIDSVKQRLKQLPLRNFEGLYTFPVNNTVIAVERDDPQASRFKIVAVNSPYLLLEPGQLLGYAYPTTHSDTFDAFLTHINANGTTAGRKGEKARHFVVTLNRSDALEFKAVKKGLKITWDWWRLFPYLFRFRVNNVNSRPEELDGAIRLWPQSLTVPPREPRYL